MRAAKLTRAMAVVVGAALAACPPALATLPQRNGSTAFDNAANLQVRGQGQPVYVGDVNGDGIGDWAIGDPAAVDPASGLTTGAVFVVYGRSDTPPPLSDTSLGTAGFAIYGTESGQEVGWSVAGAGDVNHDGVGDILIGAPGESAGGAAYVIYGSHSESDLHLDPASALGSRGFAIRNSASSAAGEELGWAVAGASDLNGDGIDDVLIGAPGYTGGGSSGAVYMVFGSPLHGDVDLGGSSVPADYGPSEPVDLNPVAGADSGWEALLGSGGERIGTSVAGIGDFNGDGYRDVAFGLARGGDAQHTGLVDVQELIAQPGGSVTFDAVFTFAGPAGSGALSPQGMTLAAAGDFNHDGSEDVIVGDPGAAGASGGTDRGAAYVVLGRVGSGGTEYTNNFTGYRIVGSQDYELLGNSVAGAADVNGDGVDDVVVGAPGFDAPAGAGSGEALVIYGCPDRCTTPPLGAGAPIDPTSLDGVYGFTVTGAHAGDGAGASVGAGGDLTGDSRADVLVGAPNDSAGGSGAGAFAVIEGFGTPRMSYPSISGQVGTALSVAPSHIEHTGATSFTATSPLPAGLSLDPSSGVISGTPTEAGDGMYTVTMSDQASSTATSVSITIAAGPAPPVGGSPQCTPPQTGTPPQCVTPVVARCVVPLLRGKTLPAARSALSAAHCRLGRVGRARRSRAGARAPRGRHAVLVIVSQALTPGSARAAGAQVAVVLGRVWVPNRRPRRRRR